MNGNPALAGAPGTDPKGAADGLGQHGPTPTQQGINALTAGDIAAVARNFYSHLSALKWIESKGSKFEYGFASRWEVIGGIKNTVIGGFKTALDFAWNRTYNLGGYTTLFGGARYEVIRPKKIETVFGTKSDLAVGAKKERVSGAWTHTAAAKEQKNEALFKHLVDSLMQEVGASLDAVIQAYEARWTTVAENAKSIRLQADLLTEKIAMMQLDIKDYKADIDAITCLCDQFEEKSSEMKIAAGSALTIKAPVFNIKGAVIAMKAGTAKFAGNLVKLGA